MLLSCHALSSSCNTRSLLPTGWQFFFHSGFQTATRCLPYFLTSCPAPAARSSMTLLWVRQRHALLQSSPLHDASTCNLEGLGLAEAWCYTHFIGTWGQVLSVQSMPKSIASRSQWHWTQVDFVTYLSFSVLHGKNIWVNVLREGLKGRHKTESHLR